MADNKPNIHLLNKKTHKAYLQKGHVDPVTHESIEPCDEVVFCAACELGFISDSWVRIGQLVTGLPPMGR
ncbi:hypothetical protein MBAV_004947, partial [Candidatus Magnetobacterium bavaricum]